MVVIGYDILYLVIVSLALSEDHLVLVYIF